MRGALMRLAIVAGLAGWGLLAGPAPQAAAHPLGNFTVSTYAGLVVAPGQIRVQYALDMAEIPTFQELPEIDTDGDGDADRTERASWAARTAAGLRDELVMYVGGERTPLRLSDAAASLRPGQGGLDILRLDATFVTEATGRGRVTFRDRTFPDRIGWHEVTAVGADGVAVSGSSVPLVSASHQLRAYPQDLLSSPLDVREASFDFGPGKQPLPAGTATVSGGRPGIEGGSLVALVGAARLSLGVVLASLAVAFGMGALHALAPGHGKTITAAYLAGGEGRVRHAVGAGIAVSIMHTASVAGLGLVILSAQRLFPPERVYPWLGLLAGAVAVSLGASLLWSRLRDRQHGHPHRRPLSRKGLTALAVSGGVLPSPTAVVVLISSAALGRVGFGLALIAAFGVGLAAALAGVGLVAMRTRDALTLRLRGRFAAAVPVLSAAAITVMGVVLTARAVISL